MAYSCVVTPRAKEVLGKTLLSKISDYNEKGKYVNVETLIKEIYDESYKKHGTDLNVEDFVVVIMSEIPSVLLNMYTNLDNSITHEIVAKYFNDDAKRKDLSELYNVTQRDNWLSKIKDILNIKSWNNITPLSTYYVQSKFKIIDRSRIPYIVSGDQIVVSGKEGLELKTVEHITNEVVVCTDNTSYNQSDFATDSNFYVITNKAVGKSVFPKGKVKVGDLLEFKYKVLEKVLFKDNGKKYSFFLNMYDAKGNDVNSVQHDSNSTLPTGLEKNIIDIITDNGRISDPEKYKRVFAEVTSKDSSGNFEWRVISPFQSIDVAGIDVEMVPVEQKSVSEIVQQKLDSLEMRINSRRMFNIFALSSGDSVFERIKRNNSNLTDDSDSYTGFVDYIKIGFLDFLSSKNYSLSNNEPINFEKYKGIHLVSRLNKDNTVSFVVCDENATPVKFKIIGGEIHADDEGTEIVYDLENDYYSYADKKNLDKYKDKYQSMRFSITRFLEKIYPNSNNDAKIDSYINEAKRIHDIHERVRKGEVVELSFASTGKVITHQTQAKSCVDYMTTYKLMIGSDGMLSTNLYGQRVLVRPTKFSDSFVDFIVALMTDKNLKYNGEPIKYNKRLSYLKQYFNNGKIGFSSGKESYEFVTANNTFGIIHNGKTICSFSLNSSNVDENAIAQLRNDLSSVDKNGFADACLFFDFNSINYDSFITPRIENGELVSQGVNLDELGRFFDLKMLALKNDNVSDGIDLHRFITVNTYQRNQLINQPTVQVQNTVTPFQQNQHTQVQQNQGNSISQDDLDAILSLPRSKVYGNRLEVISDEQNKAARDWFNNSRFSNTFDFDDAVRMANKTAYAQWTKNGITLFEGSKDVDIYHEAWHEFSQLYLSEKQWNSIVDEVRRYDGTFMDFEGHTVAFRNASELQIEEYLAEEFRSFMINNNHKPKSTGLRRFFEKIRNILKSVFGNRKKIYEVRELFNMLADNDTYGFRKDESNARHELLKRSIKGDYLKTKLGFTERQVLDTLTIMDSLVTNAVYASGGMKAKDLYRVFGDKNNFIDIYVNVYNQLDSLISKYQMIVDSNDPRLIGKKEVYENYKRLLENIKKNFWQKDSQGENIKDLSFGIAAYHFEQSGLFEDVTEVSDEEDEVDALMSAAQEHNTEANAKNTSERMSNMLKFVLSTLPGYKLNDSGEWKVARNRFLVDSRHPFEFINNKLINILHNSTTFDEMYDKMNAASKTYYPLVALVSLLGDPRKFDDIEDEDERMCQVQLWSQFAQIYKSSKTDLIQTTLRIENEKEQGQNGYEKIVGKNVSVSVGQANGPKFKLKTLYIDKFNSLNNKSEYVNVSINKNTLNINKVLADFNDIDKIRKAPRLFLHAIGIYVTNDATIDRILVDRIDNNESYKQFINNILRKLVLCKNTNEEITNIFDTFNNNNNYKKLFGKIVDEILDLDLEFTEEVNIEMVQNAEGSTQFKTMLNNTLTQKLNYLNKYDNFLDAIHDNALKDLNCLEYEYDFEYDQYGHIVQKEYKPKLDSNGQKIKNKKCNYNLLHSMFLSKMFNLEIGADNVIDLTSKSNFGKKKQDASIELVNLSGIKINDNTGDSLKSVGQKLFSTDKQTKVLADFTLAINGYYEFIRHSDKSTSYGYVTPFGNKFVDYGNGNGIEFSDDCRFNQGMAIGKLMHLLAPYIASELIRVREMRGYDNILHNANLKKNYNVLGVFDDMFGSVAHNELLELINGKDLSHSEITGRITDMYNRQADNNETNVRKDLRKYIETQIEINKSLFDNYVWSCEGILKNKLSEIRKNYNPKSKDKDFIHEKLAMNVFFTINNLLYNIECIGFSYGNTLQYNLDKDEFIKRLGGFTSSGKVFESSDIMNDYINAVDKSNAHGSYIEKYLGKKRSSQYLASDELHTAVCADINPKSFYSSIYGRHMDEIFRKKYDEIEEESNAQGLISFDAYRQLKMREGEWSPIKEYWFQKIINGEIVDEDVIEEYFPVYKLQYEGPLETEGMPAMAFHKYSLMPLIPSVIKDTNLERIHHRMLEEGIHYITFVSGSKITTLTKERTEKGRDGLFSSLGDILYDPKSVDFDNRKTEGSETMSNRKLSDRFNKPVIDEDSKKIIDENRVFTDNVIPLAYLKDQLVIHDHLETQVVFSTQMRRLIINNLMENGVPFDFNGSPEEWGNLYLKSKEVDSNGKSTEAAKEAKKKMKKSSKSYQLIKKYEWSVRTLTEISKDEIKEKIGYKKVNGKEVIDGGKLVKWIKRELGGKDVPEFITKDLDADNLSFSLYTKEIENAIMSIINRKAIRQRVHGGQFVQVAGTYWENPNGTTEEGSNDLKFYNEITVKNDKNEDELVGISCATVKIPLAGDFYHLLKLKDPADKTGVKRIGTLKRLNECLKDKEWRKNHIDYISFVACRIPVQGHNSIESFEIAEFLPQGSNNIIICPPELVVKSGGDYDVDKLSCIMPNISLVNDEPVVYNTNKENFSWTSRKELYDNLKTERENYNKTFDTYRDIIISRVKKLVARLEDSKNEKSEQLINNIAVFNSLIEKENSIKANIKTLEELKEIDDDESVSEEQERELRKVQKRLFELSNIIIESDGVSYRRTKEEIEVEKKLNEINDKIVDIKKRVSVYTRDSLENTIIKCAKEMLALSANITSLLTPNSTQLFTNKEGTGIADEFMASATYDRFKRIFDGNKEKMSPTRLIEYQYSLEKHDDFNTGKTILGPSAIDNVFSAVVRRVGCTMNEFSYNEIPENMRENIETYNDKFEAWGWKINETNFKVASDLLLDEYLSLDEMISALEKSAKEKTMNINPVEMNAMYGRRSALKELYENVVSFRRQSIFLPCNKIGNKMNLAADKDALGVNQIAEIISEYINGCVDVAKGAWVKYIQGNMEVVPVFMFMVQAGIPLKQVCYMVCNPKVVDYVESKLKLDSTSALVAKSNNFLGEVGCRGKALFLNDEQMTGKRVSVNKNVYDKLNSILEGRNKNFTEEELKYNAIKDRTKLNADEISRMNKLDEEILAQYMFIEDMARSMNSLKLAVRVDASKNNTVREVLSKQSAYHRIEEDQRINSGTLQKIMNDSVLRSFFLEDFVNKTIDDVIPYYANETINDFAINKLDYDVVNETFKNNRSKAQEKFIVEFLNYLYQVDIKNSEDSTIRDLYASKQSLIEDNGIASMSLLYGDDQMRINRFYENFDQIKKDMISQGINNPDKIKNSEAYKLFCQSLGDYSYDDNKKITLFTSLLAHYKSASPTILFSHKYDFSYCWDIVSSLIAKYPKLTGFSLLENLKSDKRDYKNGRDVESFHSLSFRTQPDSKQVSVYHEELLELQDFSKIKDIFGKGNEMDALFVTEFFNILPMYSIIQNGYNSNGLNKIIDQPNIKSLYDKWNNSEEKEKLSVIGNFLYSFNKKFSPNSPSRWKNYDYDISSVIYINTKEEIKKLRFVNSKINKEYKDMAPNASGIILFNRKDEKNEGFLSMEKAVKTYKKKLNAENYSEDDMILLCFNPGGGIDKYKSAIDNVINSNAKLLVPDSLAKNENGILKDYIKGKDNLYSIVQRSDLGGTVIERIQKGVVELADGNVIMGTHDVSNVQSLPGPDTKINIFYGTGENAELSNFAKRPFKYKLGLDNTLEFVSVEQAFQFAKIYTLKLIVSNEKKTDASAKVIEECENIIKKIMSEKEGSKIKNAGNTRIKTKNTTLNKIIDEFFSKNPEFEKFYDGNPVWKIGGPLIIKKFIKASFEQNPDAMNALLATGNATLTHTQATDEWKTEFPRVLMEVRKELMEEHPIQQTQGTQQSTISTKENPIEIYSDGSDIKGTGQIGYGAVFKHNGREYSLSGTEENEEVKKLKEKFPDAKFSNPTMEMLALACTLEYFANNNKGEHISINQDYKGAVNYGELWNYSEGSNQREPKPWNAKEAYIKHLVERCVNAIHKIESNGGSVNIKWVKGHVGNKMNELADKHAKSRDNYNTFGDVYGNQSKPVKQSLNDPENQATLEESKATISSKKTILSNDELKYWNEKGVGEMPRIMVASERTDPAFHVEEILDVINGKKDVNTRDRFIKISKDEFDKLPVGSSKWYKQATNEYFKIEKGESITGKDFAGLYIVTKHDGLPMKKLLETKIPKLIHFSITGLGGTQYEPGVMRYTDLLIRIEDYIKQGLDPECVTVRIDPIVPGVTRKGDIEAIVKRTSEMGIKRIRFSIMDAYKNTKDAMTPLGYDFSVYYDGFTAKQEYVDDICNFMISLKERYGVTLGSCAEPIVKHGISKDGCLSVESVNRMLGTSIEDKGTGNNDQRKLCSCYGGKVDVLQYNANCASHCIYCYAKHENDKTHIYYDANGKLIDNEFTRTRDVQNPSSTQPVQQPSKPLQAVRVDNSKPADPFFENAISVPFNNTTYYVKGKKIYKSNKVEVFKEEVPSTEGVRRKIFANVAIINHSAVIIDYDNAKYVVFEDGRIISVTNGNYVWNTPESQNDGKRIAIVDLADIKFDELKDKSKDDTFTNEDYDNLDKEDRSEFCEI